MGPSGFGRFFLWSQFFCAVASAPLPHIFYLLVDDWGHADAGWHAGANLSEVRTPNLDALVREGVELDRFYAHRYCSPTRSALQTGRNPIHVNVLNSELGSFNLADPVGGFEGIARNFTGIASLLKTAGYKTAAVGKWHVGMATPDHVPTGRGYDDAFNYYDGYNDQWSMRWIQHCGSAPHITNLTDFQGPRGGGPRNPAWCSQDNETGCVFQDDAFLARALDIIAAHDPSTPLFFFFSPHSVHAPLQAPAAYLARFAFVDFMPRRRMMAMVSYLDDLVGKLVTALKAKGLWDDMLFVGSSDNGGPTQTLCPPSETQGLICDAANNYPLRGGKFGNLEGGIRANAFVAGGFLPPAARGTKTAGFIAIEDWYATFAGLAGVDPTDHRAAAAGLPPIDSLDMWPLLSGRNRTSPRTELVLGAVLGATDSGETFVQGVTRADGWKLLITNEGSGCIDPAWFNAPNYPNASSTKEPPLCCGDPKVKTGLGCLFQVLEDPNETVNHAVAQPTIVAALRARIAELQATTYSPKRTGSEHGNAEICAAALGKYKGYLGPFLP